MFGNNPTGGGGGGGTGDVVGPASSTDNAIARFDGTTGKLLQNSGYTINDAGSSLVNSVEGGLTTPSFGSFLDGSYWGISTKTAGFIQIITSSTASSIFGTGGVLMLNRSTQDGAAKLNIQGAGTTTGKAFSISNSSGTTTAYIQDNGKIYSTGFESGFFTVDNSGYMSAIRYTGYNNSVVIYSTSATDYMAMGPSYSLVWSPTTVASSPDVGIKRNGVGVVEINNSTAGTYRDIKVRDLILTGGYLAKSTVAFTDGAAAQTATMTNGPTAGNPTKWIPIDDNGTTRYIPAW